MNDKKEYDVVIIGGSYAGLSAAMALGRSLRTVLIIDSGKPCNIQTPHSHNFITQDGATPKDIFEKAKNQVLKYDTVEFLNDLAITTTKTTDVFLVNTNSIKNIKAKKVLFTTGVKDIMPNIKGFTECWGISILHCPYCHGYEVAHKNLGIIANGKTAFELCTLIQNWSNKLTLFTNGKSVLTEEQSNMISKLNIEVIEKEIEEIIHTDGSIENISFKNGSKTNIDAIFSRVPFDQHCKIPLELGCKTTEPGHIEVDFFQKTNIKGVYAAGDNTSPFRAVSLATSSGTIAGAAINKELIKESLPS
ncbi:pyridine nucleotide-disulfide oxidoreductase [Polaribacter reichenbachii]|uniref:Pyridine nucleotide-disulfide oxidoreductase n=1 Tax=Polaribacter reichenbachii TaxID=996801 RepID=A0A1B8TZV5_9FLAO|nr:NAD(P)/FAD-dependent oxidoreductase [Polaribacter reichenbachii]APZ47175.1 pyridine nucleotide-disulfide oxidoreductase [Polaribacter reichenbachii]AUC17815.1 pyridine nucleotide-disulfide oxidoreductase [Polaribacter reichenbachii]OBY65161.1 pyridine nucleotide-disulfide oxidoreductase [Polaribacter reichenbachii]